FIQAQKCILMSNTKITEWEMGEHVRFEHYDHVPLVTKAVLGGGGSAEVQSYTDNKYAALIMSPVADCDLSVYLKNVAPSSPHSRSTVRTFFGCLATALSYLHTNRIRHRDLKPPNILVHGSNVLITDFGFSRDSNDTRSTTEGPPTGTTAKYNAPEVADHGQRSFSADIWSLGCIFLEMFSVLKGFEVEKLSAFMR
ncbi:kinase-like protein, partial [Lentithecium fluviatile CBS 122367]